jgi:hypothetical protein
VCLPREWPSYTLIRRLGEPQSFCGADGEEKSICHCRRSNPGHPTCCRPLVTEVTQLVIIIHCLPGNDKRLCPHFLRQTRKRSSLPLLNPIAEWPFFRGAESLNMVTTRRKACHHIPERIFIIVTVVRTLCLTSGHIHYDLVALNLLKSLLHRYRVAQKSVYRTNFVVLYRMLRFKLPVYL